MTRTTNPLLPSALLLSHLVLASVSTATTVGTLELEPCHLSNYPQEVLCGRHTVFENRVLAEGRRIDIHFAVIPAIDATSEADPLVIFPGGPGQAAMEMGPLVSLVFGKLNERRDVVLIDQRGIGSSHPLECETPDHAWRTLPADEQARLTRELLERCLEDLDADVTFYTQDLANQDIHEILIALGYERINTYGGSWGTRSALLYAHRFPEHVRAMVLDGNLPLGNPAPMYATADAERALDALFSDCSEDSACRKAFPDLEQEFDRALAVLEPNGVRVTMNDPTTGKPQTFVLTRDVFVSGLRSILYMPGLSRIVPLIIEQAGNRDYRALAAASSYFETAGAMTTGAHLTIMCSEERPRMEASRLDREMNSGFLGRAFLENYDNACSVWPTAPLPSIYSEDVHSEAPALILSGEVDPITPPRWGEAMAAALPNSLHLIAPETGHGVATQGCAPELISKFIDQGHLEGIEGDCLSGLSRPSFFIDASGPAVRLDDD
ncbi:MAG: alpha/beta fold hydrolase [Acidobacteria bacterium]|nr:alpha/beta fold hydrolase [Acidobacteriota bacterium]